MTWVDEHRKLQGAHQRRRAEAGAEAIAFGAEGIGLCRTEHMFFDHIDDLREMILADTLEDREKALAKLLPLPARGLRRPVPGDEGPAGDDPPARSAAARVPAARRAASRPSWPRRSASRPRRSPAACRSCTSSTRCSAIAAAAGHRLSRDHARCRPGPSSRRPATCKKAGIEVQPEVMIPLVGFATEFKRPGEDRPRDGREGVRREGRQGRIPGRHDDRSCRGPASCADQIAKDAEFFSFGTNDLTQTTLGMSRDDYGGFINYYRENDIIPNDPFQTIDQRRRRRADEDRRRQAAASTRPDLKLGICGEHGGDPASVMFCHEIGLNYVSCSPFRVPIARLAAAQAAVAEKAAAQEEIAQPPRARSSRRIELCRGMPRGTRRRWIDRRGGSGAVVCRAPCEWILPIAQSRDLAMPRNRDWRTRCLSRPWPPESSAFVLVVRRSPQLERGVGRHAALLHEAARALRKKRVESRRPGPVVEFAAWSCSSTSTQRRPRR